MGDPNKKIQLGGDEAKYSFPKRVSSLAMSNKTSVLVVSDSDDSDSYRNCVGAKTRAVWSGSRNLSESGKRLMKSFSQPNPPQKFHDPLDSDSSVCSPRRGLSPDVPRHQHLEKETDSKNANKFSRPQSPFHDKQRDFRSPNNYSNPHQSSQRNSSLDLPRHQHPNRGRIQSDSNLDNIKKDSRQRSPSPFQPQKGNFRIPNNYSNSQQSSKDLDLPRHQNNWNYKKRDDDMRNNMRKGTSPSNYSNYNQNMNNRNRDYSANKFQDHRQKPFGNYGNQLRNRSPFQANSVCGNRQNRFNDYQSGGRKYGFNQKNGANDSFDNNSMRKETRNGSVNRNQNFGSQMGRGNDHFQPNPPSEHPSTSSKWIPWDRRVPILPTPNYQQYNQQGNQYDNDHRFDANCEGDSQSWRRNVQSTKEVDPIRNDQAMDRASEISMIDSTKQLRDNYLADYHQAKSDYEKTARKLANFDRNLEIEKSRRQSYNGESNGYGGLLKREDSPRYDTYDQYSSAPSFKVPRDLPNPNSYHHNFHVISKHNYHEESPRSREFLEHHRNGQQRFDSNNDIEREDITEKEDMLVMMDSEEPLLPRQDQNYMPPRYARGTENHLENWLRDPNNSPLHHPHEDDEFSRETENFSRELEIEELSRELDMESTRGSEESARKMKSLNKKSRKRRLEEERPTISATRKSRRIKRRRRRGAYDVGKNRRRSDSDLSNDSIISFSRLAFRSPDPFQFSTGSAAVKKPPDSTEPPFKKPAIVWSQEELNMLDISMPDHREIRAGKVPLLKSDKNQLTQDELQRGNENLVQRQEADNRKGRHAVAESATEFVYRGLERVREKSKCRLRLGDTRMPGGYRYIHMRGEPDDIEYARKTIDEMCLDRLEKEFDYNDREGLPQETCKFSYFIPASCRYTITTKNKWEAARKCVERNGIIFDDRRNIHRGDENPPCLLEGGAENMREAKERLDEFLEPFLSEHELIMEMDPEFYGELLGIKGSNIQKLQSETMTRINLMKQDGIVQILGRKEATEKARELIEDMIRHPSITREVRIPVDKVGRLVGVHGSKIRKIQKTTLTKLDLKSDVEVDGCFILKIRGKENDVKIAEQRVEDAIVDWERPTTRDDEIIPGSCAELRLQQEKDDQQDHRSSRNH